MIVAVICLVIVEFTRLFVEFGLFGKIAEFCDGIAEAAEEEMRNEDRN